MFASILLSYDSLKVSFLHLRLNKSKFHSMISFMWNESQIGVNLSTFWNVVYEGEKCEERKIKEEAMIIYNSNEMSCCHTDCVSKFNSRFSIDGYTFKKKKK